MIILNFSNCIGAGPASIAKAFVDELILDGRELNFIVLLPKTAFFSHYESVTCSNITFKFFAKNPLLRYISLYLFSWVSCRSFPCISFGNFPIFSSSSLVLVHHSYLYDDSIFSGPFSLFHAKEKLKRIIFRFFTYFPSVGYAVQSEYVQSKIKSLYGVESIVISNPITNEFIDRYFERHLTDNSINFIYPSRFYPHKNYEFILNILRHIDSSNWNEIDVTFTLTISPSNFKDFPFLQELVSHHRVSNLGELRKSDLVYHMSNSDALFLPSKSESFGNPILESMFLGLPLVLPDLPYARSIASSSALFYRPDSVGSFLNSVELLANEYSLYARKSHSESNNFLDVTGWVDEFLAHVK